MGDGLRRVRNERRLLPELRRGRGNRQDHSGRYLRPWLPASARDGDRRHHEAAGNDRALATPNPHQGFLNMASGVLDLLQQRLAPAVRDASFSLGMLVLQFAPADLLGAVQTLKSEFQFDLFLDVTAVDWPGQMPRFEVVYHLYSTAHRVRIRLKHRVPEADPAVERLVALYGPARDI